MPTPTTPPEFDANAHLEAIVRKLRGLPPEELEKLHAARAADTRKWFPTVGPQRDAYLSLADVLLFGGSAGSGKSSLGLGLAFCEHQRSLILRRQYTNLSALTEEAIKINGTREGFNGSPPPLLRTQDGRFIQFGANQNLGDEEAFQGHAFDYKYIDEAAQWLEQQVRFHLGWLRSTDPKQRVRAVLGSNAPTSGEGEWLIAMFRPWVDDTHPRPAKPGELRWFVSTPDGKDLEIPESDLGRDAQGRRPVQRDGVVLFAMSRTFIKASLKDNPYLARTDYQAKLDALPEPLRSAVRDGNFSASRVDNQWQVIPTAWIVAAMNRWKPDGWKEFTMTAMAFDPAGGGADAAVLARRHRGWYAPLVVEQGETTGETTTGMGAIFEHRRDGAPVVVDVGGGFASGIKTRLQDNNVAYYQFQGSGSSSGKAYGSGLPFANMRAESIWRFREALDPDQEGGSPIALPPDSELKAELAALCLDARALEVRGEILIELKDILRRKLGRSPGKADAVTMCWTAGKEAVRRAERHNKHRPTSYVDHTSGTSRMRKRNAAYTPNGQKRPTSYR